MKYFNRAIIFMLTWLLTFTSCTIERRYHNGGYHFNKKHAVGYTNVLKKKRVLERHDLKSIQLQSNLESIADVFETHLDLLQNSSAIKPISVFVGRQDIKSSEEERAFVVSESLSDDYTPYPSLTIQKRIPRSLIATLISDHSPEPELEPNDERPMSRMAVLGFIMGVLGIILVLLIGWPVLMGTFGTVYSIIGLVDTAKKRGLGYAIAGLVLSLITIYLFWAMFDFSLGITL